jgi:hypothetical protein
MCVCVCVCVFNSYDKACRDRKALEGAAAFLMSPSHQKSRMLLSSQLEEARRAQVEAAEARQYLYLCTSKASKLSTRRAA